jgi:protoporphyrin/coproporphyrin ferrochelatase
MKAILMLAYASMKSIDDLLPFYTHIFHGNAPSSEVMNRAKERFRSIGVPDPLGAVTTRQAKALERRLEREFNEKIKVYQAMKHTHPFVDETMRQIIADGATELYVLPMAPLYSRTGTAAYHRSVRKALDTLGANISLVEINHWHLFPDVVEAISYRLQTALDWLSSVNRSKATVVFTAHSQPGLPQANSEFIEAFSELTQAVADKANCQQWKLAYRSAGPAPQKWLQPDVVDVIENIAREGGKAVVVCELLTLTENVEAIFDCRLNSQRKAEAHGMEFVCTEFLNDSADYIEALAEMIHGRIMHSVTDHK